MEQKKIFLKKYPNWLMAVAIIFLVMSNLLTLLILRPKNSGGKNPQAQINYPLLNPSQAYYDKKDLIVNIQPLRDQLNEIGKDRNISIYFELLNTGANVAVNKDVAIWPASLMKIPIAMAAMKKVEKGEWQMNTNFVLKEEDKNSIFGELYKKSSGTHFTLEELLNEMLIDSDNTARNIIVRNLALQDFGDVIDHIGVDFDYRKDDQISAKRYSVVWRSLFNSTYLTPENSQKIIQIMLKSSARDFLAQGIPNSVDFSHKIGVLYDEMTFADSGIVYVPNRPYILTVMVGGYNEEEARAIMKDISEKVYRYISQYQL